MRRAAYELDRLLYRIKKDKVVRRQFLKNAESVLDMYQLSGEERTALRARNYSELSKLGAKPELVIALAMASGHHPK